MGWLSKKKLIILISLLIPSIVTEDEVTKEELEEDIENALLSVKELKGFLGISKKVEESNKVLDDERKAKDAGNNLSSKSTIKLVRTFFFTTASTSRFTSIDKNTKQQSSEAVKESPRSKSPQPNQKNEVKVTTTKPTPIKKKSPSPTKQTTEKSTIRTSEASDADLVGFDKMLVKLAKERNLLDTVLKDVKPENLGILLGFEKGKQNRENK